MSKDILNEREFELVNIVGAKLGSNQRDLSQLMNLSLGMVNILIRRLIAKGYIRINQLNKRKVDYLLTPKGFAEKMSKSVKYALKTIHSIGIIKNSLKESLSQVVQQGQRDFVILGESDFAILVEMVLKEICHDTYTVSHIQEIPSTKVNAVLLICKELNGTPLGANKENSINLVAELAKNYAIPINKGNI